jgi:ABC-type branched-subunit amino acid transport system substrate-binding protein
MKEQLDPEFEAYRADSFYVGGTVIHNAQLYFYQGESGIFRATQVYSEYSTDLDSELIFSLGNEGEDTSYLEKCFYTNHYFGESTNPAVVKFVNAYKAKYNETPVSFAALGYDAVYVAKQAIEAAGSVDYDAVVEALETGTFSNLVTSSKPFSFNNGNPEKAATVITFKDGKEVEAE